MERSDKLSNQFNSILIFKNGILMKSESRDEVCSPEAAYPVVDHFEFNFEIHTINTARVRLLIYTIC